MPNIIVGILLAKNVKKIPKYSALEFTTSLTPLVDDVKVINETMPNIIVREVKKESIGNIRPKY